MEVSGRCYCGAVRYTASGDAMFRVQCHCRECQYISGGGPNLVLAMPADGFAYAQGQPKGFKRADLENGVTREFCAECGTHIATQAPTLGAVMLKVGTLDDPRVFEGPQMAVFTCDKQPFHHVPDGIATFERMPG